MPEQAKIIRHGEGSSFSIGPTVVTAKLGSDVTQRLFMAEHRLPPGFGGPPPHLHAEMEHVFYVLEGRVRVLVDDEDALLDHGDVVFVPRGLAHGFGNAGNDEARLIEFNLPGGFDRYYAELAAAFPAGKEIVPDTVRAIMTRHDIQPA